MSIHCPLPVRYRISSAACTALAAQTPQDRSLTEIPIFIGAPSGSPVSAMNPLIPWITKS